MPEKLLSTLTFTRHEALAASVAPASRTCVPDGSAVTVPAQVLLTPGVAATTRPAGSVSVKPTAVSATALGLVRRMASTPAWPGARVAVPAVNGATGAASSVRFWIALAMTTGDLARSVSLVGCELVTVLPPENAVTPPMGMVLT